jgi:hypothetical protein
MGGSLGTSASWPRWSIPFRAAWAAITVSAAISAKTVATVARMVLIGLGCGLGPLRCDGEFVEG